MDDAAPLRKTTRKRKKCEVESDADHDDHPSVHALLRQRLQKAVLGAPKPPKKIRRQAPVIIFLQSSTVRRKHQIVFCKYYDKNIWEEYAMIVKSKKSTAEIDPNYVALIQIQSMFYDSLKPSIKCILFV